MTPAQVAEAHDNCSHYTVEAIEPYSCTRIGRMSKPKRVGTHKIDSKMHGIHQLESHPIYEYRGYFIVRGFYVANTPSCVYYEVYDDKELTHRSHRYYCDNGFMRLCDAVATVDEMANWRKEP